MFGTSAHRQKTNLTENPPPAGPEGLQSESATPMGPGPAPERRLRTPMVLPCSGSHEICALCVVALRDRFGGDDGAFHCPSCREPILPCFPINKNRGLMAALRLNERLARRRR